MSAPKLWCATSDAQQVAILNDRHGAPLSDGEVERMVELLGGHPFLTRLAFFELVTGGVSVSDLFADALSDDGAFYDHLHRYLLKLSQTPELAEAMKLVCLGQTVPSDELFYRLRSAGLSIGTGRKNARPRCGLFAQYFGSHL